jgi:glycosyltransferase involved in cell wall biosynthesis
MQAMLWIGPVARLRGCRVVLHWRDFYHHAMQARTLARGADAIVAISRSTLSFAADLLGAASPKLSLILNGVSDLPACDPDQINVTRRGLGIPADGLLVLMAGQSVPRKGHAVLIEGLAGVNQKRSDVHSLLLCQEHDRSAANHTRELHRQAAELGCDARVQIRNGVQHLAPMLHAADIVAVPSLREPFGRIAVEAMLARKPVIASEVDGLKEIVQQPETGFLVPPGNPVRLASGLIGMLEARASLQLRGEAGRRRARNLFAVSRVAAEVVSLYTRVLSADLAGRFDLSIAAAK